MMTPEAAGLLFANAPVQISVPDCSLLSEVDLTERFAQCSNEQLEVGDLAFFIEKPWLETDCV